MELKRKKYINNRLPKFGEGKIDYGSAATGLLETGASIYNAHQFDTTADDYMNKYGYRTDYIGDIGYTRRNDIDMNSEMTAVELQNKANNLKTTLTGAGTGAAIGTMIAPGIGTAIGAVGGALVGFVGGLLGGSSRKRKARREAEEAQQRTDNLNEMSRFGALTAQLLQLLASRFGDTRSQQLFHNGKSPIDYVTGYTKNKYVVETPFGPNYTKQNSYVEEGETLLDRKQLAAHYVNHGQNDSAKANIKDDQEVIGSMINPYTGNKLKDDAKPITLMIEKIDKDKPKSDGWLSKLTQRVWDNTVKPIRDDLFLKIVALADILNELKMPHRYNNIPRYNIGKQYDIDLEDGTTVYGQARKKPFSFSVPIPEVTPNFRKLPLRLDLPKDIHTFKKPRPENENSSSEIGWWNSAIPAVIGASASIQQYLDAKHDTPYRPNTFVGNPYLLNALTELAGLDINTYPIIQKLRDAESRSNYAINASGGLSTSLKYLSRLSSLNNTQLNIANLIAAAQDLHNKYRTNYANAELLYGDAEAKRQQLANQYDIDYYGKASASRSLGMLTGISNLIAAVNQFTANELKRKLYNGMINRYGQDLTQDQIDYLNSL